jgi:hypothetical protein
MKFVRINNTQQILPSEFNPITYKTVACPLRKYCKLDSKLCLNYHSFEEKRRNPKKFRYSAKNCINTYDVLKKVWKDSDSCLDVFFCNFRGIDVNLVILFLSISTIAMFIRKKDVDWNKKIKTVLI